MEANIEKNDKRLKTWGVRLPVNALDWLHIRAHQESLQQKQNRTLADLVKDSLRQTYGDEFAKLL